MRINTTVAVNDLNITATFTEEDFPRRELLEETEWVKIPDSYRGISDDPYLAAAFNAAIKASLQNVLYNDSVLTSATGQHASPSISKIVFARFNIPSKIFDNFNHAHMETMNRSKPFGTTDLQFYYYIIAEFLNQVTYSGGLLQDAHYAYYELHERIYLFFFLPLEKDETLTQLPPSERWATYKGILEAIAGFSYTNIGNVIESNHMDAWKFSEALSLQDVEKFHEAFKALDYRTTTTFTHKKMVILMESLAQNPETVIDVLNNSPKSWLEKIFEGKNV